MLPTSENLQMYLLGPIVQQWMTRLNAAKESKKRFNLMAKLCRQFLGSSAKAMWEDSFRREFYPGVQSPEFMVSLNKAFELVAIIGPSLYWTNPVREVKSPDVPDQAQIAQLFGITDEAMVEQIQLQSQSKVQEKQIRNALASLVLENISREMPGGPVIDNQILIQDALVTGRGCGWTETYSNSATGELQVGTFFDPVDNLLIDPDAKDPALRDVKWLSRTHIDPIWVVERKFNLPPGYLKDRGTHMTSEFVNKQNESGDSSFYLDAIEWVEIWSIGGIGARVTGVNPSLGYALDQLTGDNCYLCLTPTLPHPLNLPPVLVGSGQPQDIQDALRWRTANYGSVFELWREKKWPVELLDFYPVVGSVWPMAVLGPGIGCLLAMNILFVSHLSMSWDRRRDIILVNQAYAKDVSAAIQSEANPAVIKVLAASQMPLDQVATFMVRPEVQGDLLGWIQYLDSQFKMATGLDDIHYGISKTQVRVQSDIQARTSAANVRPEKMAHDVHHFMINTGTKELWLAAGYIPGQRLQSLLGDFGAMAWDMLVHNVPFDVLSREMELFIEATDMRRRDRDKDMTDLEKLLPFYLPLLMQYCKDTQDTKPLNALLHRFAEASYMRNPEELYLGQWTPPVDPEMQKMQIESEQIKSQKTVAETEETKAKTVGRLIDAQYKQQGAAAPAAQRMQWDSLMNAQKLKMIENTHLQKLVHLQETQDLQTKALKERSNAKA